MSDGTLSALVLAGGSGTRFWPVSRRARPKQLLTLVGGSSLLRQTVLRLSPLVEAENVWLSATRDLAPSVAAEVSEIDAGRCVVEPCARNTAPAILWALLQLPEGLRSAPMIVTPSDHWVRDEEAFRRALRLAVAEVEDHDRILTLGVVPRRPETGFGYLELEKPASGIETRRLARFVEKPDEEHAREFAVSGRHLWNAGIFVFRPQTLLARCAELQPGLLEGLRRAQSADAAEDRERLFADLPAVSIDVALMERLDALWTVPLDCGWSDLGSWEALAEVLRPDSTGNCTLGDVLALDAHENVLVADRGTVAVLGLSDLVVVRTEDCVLVLPRSRAQEVRRIVDALGERGSEDLL